MNSYQIVDFLVQFIDVLRRIIVYAIIGRVIISWFSMGGGRPSGRFAGFIYDITDPFVNLAKKLPHSIAMIDFSPMIALFGVDLLAQLLIMLLSRLV